MKLDIFSRKLSLGAKLPSVREYAITFQVNPNTMQRALVELESEGLVRTNRTTGRYVTTDFDLVNEIRTAYVRGLALDFFAKISEIGATRSEIIDILKEE